MDPCQSNPDPGLSGQHEATVGGRFQAFLG